MPRKSVAQHELEGTKPHYDTGPTGRQSHIAGGKPKCPKYLTGDARKKFKALSRELVARRAATPGDSELIALYATLWERWRIADDHVKAEGAVVEKQYFSRDGQPYTRDVKNPWLEAAQSCEKQMLACLEKLGLSVATRDRRRAADLTTSTERRGIVYPARWPGYTQSKHAKPGNSNRFRS